MIQPPTPLHLNLSGILWPDLGVNQNQPGVNMEFKVDHENFVKHRKQPTIQGPLTQNPHLKCKNIQVQGVQIF